MTSSISPSLASLLQQESSSCRRRRPTRPRWSGTWRTTTTATTAAGRTGRSAAAVTSTATASGPSGTDSSPSRYRPTSSTRFVLHNTNLYFVLLCYLLLLGLQKLCLYTFEGCGPVPDLHRAAVARRPPALPRAQPLRRPRRRRRRPRPFLSRRLPLQDWELG